MILGWALNIFAIVIYTAFCIFSYKAYKRFGKEQNAESKDNSNENSDDINLLDRVSVLKPSNKKFSNIDFKQSLKNTKFILIFMTLFIIFIGIYNSIILKVNIFEGFKSVFETWEMFVSYVIIVFIMTILSMLPSIKYWNSDKKIIDKEKINVLEYNDLNNIDNYNIFIPNRNKKWKDVTFERYFIVDDNNNLLYKVKQYGLTGLKYIIIDQFDNKVGEIQRNGYMTYIVRLVNQEPFAVKWRLNIGASNFKIIGLDYKVQGSGDGLKSIITYKSVEDIVATVNSNSILGETKVNIKQNITNKQKIIAISLVIKIGNIRYWNMKVR